MFMNNLCWYLHNVHPMLFSYRANAAGDGITSRKHWFNASCMPVARGHLLHN